MQTQALSQLNLMKGHCPNFRNVLLDILASPEIAEAMAQAIASSVSGISGGIGRPTDQPGKELIDNLRTARSLFPKDTLPNCHDTPAEPPEPSSFSGSEDARTNPKDCTQASRDSESQ